MEEAKLIIKVKTIHKNCSTKLFSIFAKFSISSMEVINLHLALLKYTFSITHRNKSLTDVQSQKDSS